MVQGVRSSPKFCVNCGTAVAKRKWNPIDIPFLFCHACGEPLPVTMKPTCHIATQTPIELMAFSTEEARESALTAVLTEFAEKAAKALDRANLHDDMDCNFSFSPRTARDRVRDLVRTHEESLVQLKRVHDGEVRALQSRVAIGEALFEQWQAERASLMSRVELLEQSLQQRSEAIEAARREVEEKCRSVSANEAALRAAHDREIAAAWRHLSTKVMSVS